MKYLISAGHGGKDHGACANGYKESEVAMMVRSLVASRLIEMRHAVLQDGGDGVNLPLSESIKLVDAADLAVELHCNASVNLQATGIEVISLPSLKPVAQRIAKAIAGETGQRLRGSGGWIDQSQSQHSRLGFVEAGGLIVEMVFITNLSDMRSFISRQEKVAQAIAGAMCAYEVAA